MNTKGKKWLSCLTVTLDTNQQKRVTLITGPPVTVLIIALYRFVCPSGGIPAGQGDLPSSALFRSVMLGTS